MINPAQLWIGSVKILEQEAISYIQQQLCLSKCQRCATCNAIAAKNHSSTVWVQPEKNYTLELLDPVFHALSFALDDGAHFFIILEKAELLSEACANKLLKVMEEPPTGYHFVLLAYNKQSILPTIQSRCTIKYSSYQELNDYKALFDFFIHNKQLDQLHFSIEQAKINEQDAIIFVEKLLEFYMLKFQGTCEVKQKDTYNRCIQRIQKALEYPPMPGSTKLFLKNLFLQLNS